MNGGSAVASTEERSDVSQRTILVVDDAPLFRELETLFLARSGRVSTTAAAPSVTRQQSSLPSGSEIIRALTTSSMVSGSLTNASGLSPAHPRAATATSAKSSLTA